MHILMYLDWVVFFMFRSWGSQPADSQRELRGSSVEEAAGQSSAAAAGAEQTGGGVSELSSRPEGALLHCVQTVRHQSKCKTTEEEVFLLLLLNLCFLSQGENVLRELQALVKDLPAVLKKVGEDAAKLEKHIKIYTAFTDFVCGWWVSFLNKISFPDHTRYCWLF